MGVLAGGRRGNHTGGALMILNDVQVDEYYTIDLPDHDRHKQVVRVVHDSWHTVYYNQHNEATGYEIHRELCVVEDENQTCFRRCFQALI